MHTTLARRPAGGLRAQTRVSHRVAKRSLGKEDFVIKEGSTEIFNLPNLACIWGTHVGCAAFRACCESWSTLLPWLKHSETTQLFPQSTAEAKRPNLLKDYAFTDHSKWIWTGYNQIACSHWTRTKKKTAGKGGNKTGLLSMLPSGSKLCGCARRPEGLCWAKNNFQAWDPNSAQWCQAVPVCEEAKVAKLKITCSREIFFSLNWWLSLL